MSWDDDVARSLVASSEGDAVSALGGRAVVFLRFGLQNSGIGGGS